MKDKLRAVLVDDERLANKEMRLLLSKIPAVEIVGEADSLATASVLINKEKPDVVFLDIELSDGLGFDLLPQIPPDSEVIFVTAYEKYAIRAFEVNVLDYLTKPINFKRLEKSVLRVMQERKVDTESKPAFEMSDQIYLRFGNRNQFVKLKDLAVIMSCGDYTEVHLLSQQGGMVLKTMKEWEESLPNTTFLRIHRSAIINLEHLKQFNQVPHHEPEVIVSGYEKPLTVSRRSLPELRRVLKAKE